MEKENTNTGFISFAYNLLSDLHPVGDFESVVFDIDDTLIDSLGKPMFDVIDLYLYARKLRFKIFIITARAGADDNIRRTIVELEHFGITGYTGLYFRHPDNHNVENYKLVARRKIFEDGFNTVMSVGDMPWDIGLYGGVGIII